MRLAFALGAIFGLAVLPSSSMAASANMASMKHAISAAADHSLVIQVAGRRGGGRADGVHRGGVNRNVNRNVHRNVHRNVNRNVHRNVHRNVNRNVRRNVHGSRGLYSGRHVYHGGAWVRPRAYWWPRGGAVAAGAALGFVAAAAAISWAGTAPGPNYCWYYTDPSHRQGFWDYCP